MSISATVLFGDHLSGVNVAGAALGGPLGYSASIRATVLVWGPVEERIYLDNFFVMINSNIVLGFTVTWF